MRNVTSENFWSLKKFNSLIYFETFSGNSQAPHDNKFLNWFEIQIGD